jgi:hypothetical protein
MGIVYNGQVTKHSNFSVCVLIVALDLESAADGISDALYFSALN